MPIWNAPNQTQVNYLLQTLPLPKRAKWKVTSWEVWTFTNDSTPKRQFSRGTFFPLINHKIASNLHLTFIHGYALLLFQILERFSRFSHKTWLYPLDITVSRKEKWPPVSHAHTNPCIPAHLPRAEQSKRYAVTGRYSVAPCRRWVGRPYSCAKHCAGMFTPLSHLIQQQLTRSRTYCPILQKSKVRQRGPAPP